jgi:hypothetical protein
LVRRRRLANRNPQAVRARCLTCLCCRPLRQRVRAASLCAMLVASQKAQWRLVYGGRL